MMRIALALVLILTGLSARADFLGVYFGGGFWNTDLEGDVVSDVNVVGELGVEGDTANYVYFAFEHPIPLVPNLRLERTGISDTGTGTLANDVTFAGQTFPAGSTVEADINLTSTDVTAYYELLDLAVDLDVGLTARIFTGDLRIDTGTEDITGGVPMLYARGKVGLPFTGTYLSADINTVSWKDNQLTDYSLIIGWEIENFILPEFGIEGGYRRWTLTLDEDDFDVGVDTDLDGLFINLTAHF